MAWDTDRTRRLLLAAATSEFSERGYSGARVNRIAVAAGVNKERIYRYFGSKSDLFDAVVAVEMTRIMEVVPVVGVGPDAVVDYADRMFAHHTANSVLARLLFWEGLEGRAGTAYPDRVRLGSAKVDSLSTALPQASREQCVDLLLTIITLCCGQPVLAHVGQLLLDTRDDDPERRRAAILRMVRLVVEDLSDPTQ